jgi:hypothetical protein
LIASEKKQFQQVGWQSGFWGTATQSASSEQD